MIVGFNHFRLSLGCGRELSAHLLPELPHRGDLTRIEAFRPGFEALCCFFQVFEELSIDETLASLWRRVLERDGWRCQGCGLLRQLEVHHICRGADSEAMQTQTSQPYV